MKYVIGQPFFIVYNISDKPSLGHSKLHFCFWSWIFQRTMRVGATSASQPPIQVNECWSFIVKMLAHHFTHALCKLLRMLKIWKLPEACGRRTRNRSTTWRGLTQANHPISDTQPTNYTTTVDGHK